jgi:CBS domain-containing protein
MEAGEIMHKPVLTTTPRASVRDIAIKLLANRISGMPVTDRDGTVLGVITEENILRALMEQKGLEALSAQDIMSKDLVAVRTETSLEGVMQILHDEGIRRVPVTDNGRLVGIISRADVIRVVLDLEFLTFGQDVAPVPSQDRPTGKRQKRQPKSTVVRG